MLWMGSADEKADLAGSMLNVQKKLLCVRNHWPLPNKSPREALEVRAERRPLVVQLTLQVHQPQLQRRIRLLQLLHSESLRRETLNPFPSRP